MAIYIFKNNRQSGPFEERNVFEWLVGGQLSPEDLAVRQGDNNWQPLRILFPNAQMRQAVAPQNFVNHNSLASNAKNPPTRKGSGAILFLSLGLIGLILVSLIGAAAFVGISRKNRKVETENFSQPNTNTADTNSAAKTSTEIFKELKDKAKDFASLKPPVKLERKPVLKGKIAIVEQTDADNEYTVEMKGVHSYDDKYDETELEQNGLTKEHLAKNPGEIDTLVQTSCAKGKLIGTYKVVSTSIPAYSKICKVSVIDYRESKVIAQKTFENRELPLTITVTPSTKEYVLLHPYENIQKYVKSLPKQ